MEQEVADGKLQVCMGVGRRVHCGQDSPHQHVSLKSVTSLNPHCSHATWRGPGTLLGVLHLLHWTQAILRGIASC